MHCLVHNTFATAKYFPIHKFPMTYSFTMPKVIFFAFILGITKLLQYLLVFHLRINQLQLVICSIRRLLGLHRIQAPAK